MDMFKPKNYSKKVLNTGLGQILRLENFLDTDNDTFLSYEMHGKSLRDNLFKIEKVTMAENDERFSIVKH
jgi:hypothetical protein